ncbi:MAG TPA: hypothetical protein VN736_05740 [Candidatus Limnocylindrales bacterium]|nr:hypothetical protein [Candidatus Limnocylindrales bacterium]
MAIAIEIRDGEVIGLLTGGERRTWRRMKTSAAVIEQDRDLAIIGICDDEIRA